MTTPEPGPGSAPDLGESADIELGAGPVEAPAERPATSDPDAMVDTPDQLGGTGGPDPGGAG